MTAALIKVSYPKRGGYTWQYWKRRINVDVGGGVWRGKRGSLHGSASVYCKCIQSGKSVEIKGGRRRAGVTGSRVRKRPQTSLGRYTGIDRHGFLLWSPRPLNYLTMAKAVYDYDVTREGVRESELASR
ncbi:hypothetical protein IF1G_08868 [Cordyceps javanica]|uniref:Uncharacterized protein n=1 Tax=Cordyceps javanica TaxID=43265 RepID=A0A545USB8_9HYPO|nr:hypothetical protein IF1G_08868 [Cordyceps javanica]